jgi:hypothetical protein
MTLVVTALARGLFTFQVTDRLVSTLQSSGTLADYEVTANKSLVIALQDSLFVIGYTGLAYIESRPTDQWLAETITEMDLTTGAFIPCPMRPVGHIEQAAQRIRAALDSAFSRVPTRNRIPHTVAIGGLQRRRRGVFRPLLWTISNSAADRSRFQLVRENLELVRWSSAFVTSVEPSMPTAALEAMRTNLRAYGEESPNRFEEILVAGVRDAAKTQPGVSEDCMAVRVWPVPGGVEVEAKHFADSGGRGAVGYSPWLISPGWINAPAEIRGSTPHPWDLHNGVRFRVSGPEQLQADGTRQTFGLRRQSRRRPPA